MNKEKFTIEFDLKSVSLNLLWTTISTPSGLEEWFADKVTINGKKHTFTWSGNSQEAELVGIRTGNYVRFKWLEDKNEKYYFEFKITVDDVTSEVGLAITDFAEPDEINDAKTLWNKQIKDMLHSIGL